MGPLSHISNPHDVVVFVVLFVVDSLLSFYLYFHQLAGSITTCLHSWKQEQNVS